MGAYHIWDLSFKTDYDRSQFEKLFCDTYNDMIVPISRYHLSIEYPDEEPDVVYNVGYCGYAEAESFLELCDKSLINIKYFASLPISDRFTDWTLIKGRVPKYFKSRMLKKQF